MTPFKSVNEMMWNCFILSDTSIHQNNPPYSGYGHHLRKFIVSGGGMCTRHWTQHRNGHNRKKPNAIKYPYVLQIDIYMQRWMPEWNFAILFANWCWAPGFGNWNWDNGSSQNKQKVLYENPVLKPWHSATHSEHIDTASIAWVTLAAPKYFCTFLGIALSIAMYIFCCFRLN